VTCRGYLDPIVPGEGKGVLYCTDKREGHFSYHQEEDGTGTGYGRLGDDPLTLTFN
jgi:hypothetical protein